MRSLKRKLSSSIYITQVSLKMRSRRKFSSFPSRMTAELISQPFIVQRFCPVLLHIIIFMDHELQRASFTIGFIFIPAVRKVSFPLQITCTPTWQQYSIPIMSQTLSSLKELNVYTFGTCIVYQCGKYKYKSKVNCKN